MFPLSPSLSLSLSRVRYPSIPLRSDGEPTNSSTNSSGIGTSRDGVGGGAASSDSVCEGGPANGGPVAMDTGADNKSSKPEAIFAFDFMKLTFADLLWAPSVTPVLSHAFAGAGEDDAEGGEEAVHAASGSKYVLCSFCSSGGQTAGNIPSSFNRYALQATLEGVREAAGPPPCECSAHADSSVGAEDSRIGEARTFIGKKRKISPK